jgi:hypothetical protein
MVKIEKIQDLIDYLEVIKAKEGNIAVCSSENDEYWGTCYNWLYTDYNLKIDEYAKPNGIKNSFTVKALVISNT